MVTRPFWQISTRKHDSLDLILYGLMDHVEELQLLLWAMSIELLLKKFTHLFEELLSRQCVQRQHDGPARSWLGPHEMLAPKKKNRRSDSSLITAKSLPVDRSLPNSLNFAVHLLQRNAIDNSSYGIPILSSAPSYLNQP